MGNLSSLRLHSCSTAQVCGRPTLGGGCAYWETNATCSTGTCVTGSRCAQEGLGECRRFEEYTVCGATCTVRNVCGRQGLGSCAYYVSEASCT